MKRRRFSAEFKRKVVLEAMRGDEAVRVIAARHKIYPYLLNDLERIAPGEVICADFTYIPMRGGVLRERPKRSARSTATARPGSRTV